MELLFGLVAVVVLLCFFVLWKRRGNTGSPKHLRGSSVNEQRVEEASGGHQIHTSGDSGA